MNASAVILAAGQGTRMKSKLPKVLHPLMGRPLISYAVQAAGQAVGGKPVVVVGQEADAIRTWAGDSADFVVQEEQLGTGHALRQAESLLLGRADLVLVTAADMPLLRAETLQQLIQMQSNNPGPISMLTVIANDPRGFGRVVRGSNDQVLAVVEEAAASPEQLAIRELNTSTYCFEAAWLWQTLPEIPLSAKGEYYLTDLVEIAAERGLPIQALTAADPWEAAGINTRVHLAEIEAEMRQRINTEWLLAGVTIIDPLSTYIEPDVQIGQDTTIWPNTYLYGTTEIGANCTLGPNTIVRNSSVAERCRVIYSVIECATLEAGVDVGPFSHLRTGAYLAQGVHLGNFSEVKNSYLGQGTKMGHFSYIGDATLGENVNIGAGTITCNFDGEKKNHTEIGSDVFIGSDTMLVAPVKIGRGGRTGAGSVVTKNVAEDTLVVGMPARPIRRHPKRE